MIISCIKYVITQENLNGYSDEVKKYGHGTLVDFNENRAAALKIKRKLNCLKMIVIKLILIHLAGTLEW